MMNGVGCVGLDEDIHLVQRTHGYAIAELAMAFPAFLMIVAVSISLIGLTVTQVKLESAAALGARTIGRGDLLSESFRNSLPEGTEIFIESESELVQFTLKTEKELGIKSFPLRIELAATAYARLESPFEELR